MAEAVECLSSASYPGDPLAFSWQGQRREVQSILQRWRGPAGIGFRVRTKSSNDLSRQYQDFELFYDASADAWRVTPL